MRDLMPEVYGLSQKLAGVGRRAVAPRPCGCDVRRTDGAGDDAPDLLHRRVVEVLDPAARVGVERGPSAQPNSRRRPEHLNALAHHLLDVRLPCGDTDDNQGTVQPSEPPLTAPPPRSKVVMRREDLFCVEEQRLKSLQVRRRSQVGAA